MNYDKKFLTAMKVKLNGGDYSETWYRNHFRGMIDCIEQHIGGEEYRKAYIRGLRDGGAVAVEVVKNHTSPEPETVPRNIPKDMTGNSDIF